MDPQKKQKHRDMSWGIIFSIVATIIAVTPLFLFFELFSDMDFYEDHGERLAYISYDLIVAIACFFICKRYPYSVWLVPLIMNVTGIIAAFVEPEFWVTELWILYCSGWVLSISAAIIGSKTGRRKAHS